MTPPRRPFLWVDNEILDRMAEIGVGPIAVLLQLLCHRNRQTGQCNPSYATLGRETGLHRDTVIRHVQKLKALGWIIKRPSWAQEGDQSSNWYEFPEWIVGDRTEPPGSRTTRPPLSKNAESYDHGGRTVRPEPKEKNQQVRTKDVSSPKIEETEDRNGIPADATMLTPTQQSCTHHAGTFKFDNLMMCGLCFAALTPSPSNGRDANPPQADIRLSAEIH